MTRDCTVWESWKDREARRCAALATVPAPELAERIIHLERTVADLRQGLQADALAILERVKQ